jgi:hypothetical protein
MKDDRRSGTDERRFDGELDRALGRLFEAPRELEGVLERVLAAQGGEGGQAGAWRSRGWRSRGVLIVAGVAAAVVGLAALGALLAPEPVERGESVARLVPLAPASLLQPQERCLPAVGPLEDSSAEPTAILAPDLERLYREVVECDGATTPSLMACGAADRLDSRLASTYGEHVKLKASAAGVLHGPFSSKEWPTGTILTGFPEDRTAVLVAERISTLDCCLSPRLSQESGLNLFTWQVGDLVLAEITPLEEPKLLDCFEF